MTKPPIAGITSDLSLPEASVCTVMGPSMLGVPAVRFARGDLMHLIILECNMAWFWTVEHCDHVSKHLCTTYKGYRVSGWKNKWRLTDRNWPIATRLTHQGNDHISLQGSSEHHRLKTVLAGMGYGNPAGLGKGQKRKKSWMPWRLAAHGRIWWSVCWLQCIFHLWRCCFYDFLMGKSCRKWCFCVLCLDFFQSFPIMILTNHHLTQLMSSHFSFGWVWDPRNRSMTVCAW